MCRPCLQGTLLHRPAQAHISGALLRAVHVHMLAVVLEVLASNAQGPLSRFGDTAANAGTLALLDSYDSTRGLNVGIKTLAASTSAGLFRIALMPIDACKTILQARSRRFRTHLPRLTSARVPRVASSLPCWAEQAVPCAGRGERRPA